MHPALRLKEASSIPVFAVCGIFFICFASLNVLCPIRPNQPRTPACVPFNIDTQSSDETSNPPFEKGLAGPARKGALARFVPRQKGAIYPRNGTLPAC
jgi:hypothetical protein